MTNPQSGFTAVMVAVRALFFRLSLRATCLFWWLSRLSVLATSWLGGNLDFLFQGIQFHLAVGHGFP